ncbi:hypothetical protein CLOM_g16710 [Closterium sp. NIES-68]|nr:hypothetical protein CLOM_g16710 [Closterium sp. NIES-68]
MLGGTPPHASRPRLQPYSHPAPLAPRTPRPAAQGGGGPEGGGRGGAGGQGGRGEARARAAAGGGGGDCGRRRGAAVPVGGERAIAGVRRVQQVRPVHDTQGPAAAAFKDASKDVDGVRFALTMHAAVAAALGWQGDAAAALARTGREEAVVAVLKRQQDAFVPHEGPFTREAVAAFVRKNRLPLFVHFDDDAVEQFGKHTKWHIVIFCPRAAFSHFEQSLAPLARQHKGKVHFALVDSSDEDASGIPMDYFGVRVDETAVIAVFTDTTQGEPQESKHRLTEDPTPANMQAFITAFLAGELPPYYKSDPVPAKNDGVVRTVVGRTFDDIVMDEARDVMLMLSYGDECPSCEALLPCFTRLALRLSAVPPLLFAHMDFASNEVPGLELEAFPTVLLYRAHNKSHPVAVQDRLVRWRHMVRTLREHGGTALPEGLEEEVQEEGAEYEAARREEAAQAAAEVKDEL